MLLSLHGLSQRQKQKGTGGPPAPSPVPNLFSSAQGQPLCLEGSAQHCCETPPQELSGPWEVLVKGHFSVLGCALRGRCHFQLFFALCFVSGPKAANVCSIVSVVLIEMCSQSCSQPALYAGFGPPQQKSVGCVHMFCFSFSGESGGEGLSSPHSASRSWRSKSP